LNTKVSQGSVVMHFKVWWDL